MMGNHSYGFDGDRKVKSVDSTTAYRYDGEGKRVRKLVGENTRFIYGIGGQVIAEYDGSSGNLKKEYVAGGGSMITIEPTAINSNGAQYATGDHLGSPRVITNSSGSVVSRHDYMPFGEELAAGTGGRTTGMGFSNSGDNNRKKFTGYERDTETGLDFAQARFYGSTQGRFTSPDPFSASAIIADPQTFNRYAYCRNNPVNSVDPSGMSAYAAMQNEGAQERRQASWQSGHDIIEEEEAWYAQNVAATYAAIAQANYLNQAVASGAMTASSAAGIASSNPMLGVGFGVPQNTSQNRNCIEGAVQGGRLAGRGLEEAISSITGPRGVPIHDGEHVLVPPGTTANVTALPLMAGQILHSGRQTADRGSASYAYSVVDILLNTRINGQEYVMTLKDMFYDTGKLRGRVNAGDVLGSVEGHSNPNDEAGLHVTLYPYSVYKQYIQNKGFGPAARSSVPFKSLMSAGHDPRSPFRCP